MFIMFPNHLQKNSLEKKIGAIDKLDIKNDYINRNLKNIKINKRLKIAWDTANGAMGSVIKDLLCIAPEYGKKIARKVFKKDLKCGNIFMNLEENPISTNRIKLDKNLKDSNGVPISNLYYKQSMYLHGYLLVLLALWEQIDLSQSIFQQFFHHPQP